MGMQIFVRVEPFTITIDVESSDSIEGVLAKIQDRIGLPAGQPQLTYNGTILEPGRTLDDYNIQKLSVLVLTVAVVTPEPMPTTTKFYSPSLLINRTFTNTETNQTSIDWNYNGAISQNNYATTSKPLYTVSGIWMERFLTTTSQLLCINLGISNADRPVQGVEFNLLMERAGRVEDLVIQLTQGGVPIGNNLANTTNPVIANMYTGDRMEAPAPYPGNNYTYGGPGDLWGTALTSADVADPTFGVIVSFKSNVAIPHRDLAYLYQLGIRITYA